MAEIQLSKTKSLEDYLKVQEKPFDFSSRKTSYGELGLESRLGVYKGSGQQNTAILNLLRDQEPKLGAGAGYISSTGEFISTAQPGKEPEVIRPELREGTIGWIDPVSGKFVASPTFVNQEVTTEEKVESKDISTAITQVSEATSIAKMKGQLAESATTLKSMNERIKAVLEKEGTQVQTVTTDAGGATTAVKGDENGGGTTPMSQNDLAGIISDISTGALSIPELEIDKAKSELAGEAERARASAALARTQQMLASRGMAFSGIRTKEEAALAAEHLANMSGISLKLAGSIISAARQEQSRRQPQYRTVGGDLYQINADGTTQKIISAPPDVEEFRSGGKLFKRDPETGVWNLELEVADEETLTYKGKRYVKDATTGEWRLDFAAPDADEEDKPIITTAGGKRIDISTVDGLIEYKENGGDPVSSAALLDITTDYTTETIRNMTTKVWGETDPKKLFDAQKTATVEELELLPSTAKQSEVVKAIEEAGFEPKDDFWLPFLSRFVQDVGWPPWD